MPAKSAPTGSMAKSHAWQSWENMFALKKAIETSGWKTKKDDQGVIEALEGLADGELAGLPQGAKVLRKEDHSGMIDCYISRVENDELHGEEEDHQGRADGAPAAPRRPVQAIGLIRVRRPLLRRGSARA